FGQHLPSEGIIGNKVHKGLSQALAQAFVVEIEERLVCFDWPTDTAAELVKVKWRQLTSIERRTRIQRRIAQRIKASAVELIGAAFRNHIDLRTAGRSRLGRINISADAELGNRVERNIKPRVGLLRLFLNAARIYAIESEVTVIERVAGET